MLSGASGLAIVSSGGSESTSTRPRERCHFARDALASEAWKGCNHYEMLRERMAAFGNWDSRAAVRCSPRRVVDQSFGEQGLLFAPELVPGWRSAAFCELSSQALRRLLASELLAYLEFTVHLETCVIVPVAQEMATVLPPGIPTSAASFRADALRLLCDEAYHAYAAADLMGQVCEATGVRAPPPPRLRSQLDNELADLDGRERALARLLFAVVSETLVSRAFAALPRDERVHPAVRGFVHDHYQDEWQHHVFFSQVFERVWPTIAPESQHRLGMRLPRFIELFLEPDLRAATQSLQDSGEWRTDLQAALELGRTELMRPEELIRRARGCLKVFEHARVYDRPALRARFEAADLLPRAGAPGRDEVAAAGTR